MNLFNLYYNSDSIINLKKGITGDNFIIFLKDNYFYVQLCPIRCFRFSLRRAKNILNMKNIEEITTIFLKYIKNINIEKINENLFFLNISYPLNGFSKFDGIILNKKIKLKEINNFLFISDYDDRDKIIKKQNDKIKSLLDKIEEYENKYKEPNTDDELFITIE